MKSNINKEMSDMMRNKPSNWKVGVFYFNPDDPRIIVPKRFAVMGWTLNFASPYAYISLIAIIAVAMAFSIWLE